MALPLSPPDLDDRSLYPLHEEDDVPETSLHERVVRYLRDAIAAFARHWFVTGNICVYWERGNFAAYVAPDLFVVKEPLPEPDPRVYQLWRDPPIRFVAEVVSRTTAGDEEETRLPKYQDFLRVPEHLFYDPDHQVLKLRRLGLGGYEEVKPDGRGRVRSEQLDLEFGLDEDGFLWVYTLDGERLMTHEEEVLRRKEAEARASQEADRRAEAEARVLEEKGQRAEEARRWQEAEARARELERELAALRARLQDETGHEPGN